MCDLKLFGDICQTCKINKPKFRLIVFASTSDKKLRNVVVNDVPFVCPLSGISCWECPTNKCLSIKTVMCTIQTVVHITSITKMEKYSKGL